jgi:SAM-dependent methyltransferase
MKCYLCDIPITKPSYVLDADKYENLIGVTTGKRYWYHCSACGLFQQENFLNDNKLDDIYRKYRDLGIRKTSIKDEFNRIKNIPDSENRQRMNQMLADGVFKEGKALDIGSGLGIFPYYAESYFKDMYCIEPNPESASFINKDLRLKCFEGFYEPGIWNTKFDFISCIHILEHAKDPIQFLSDIKTDLRKDGILFIEVPDSVEFDYLPKEHDEFNSCHVFMFDVSTLDRILRTAGFLPYLVRRIKYKERNLSRIYAYATI